MRADNQSTLALHLVTPHGRAMPLIWLTVDKDELKSQRNDFEDACLNRLKATLPEGASVTILADRGFGDVKLFEFLESLGFRYVIRIRGNIHVRAADGETRLAAESARRTGKRGWPPSPRGGRGNAAGRRLGRKGRTGAQTARRGTYRRPSTSRRAGVREGSGHEGGLASGRQRRRASGL